MEKLVTQFNAINKKLMDAKRDASAPGVALVAAAVGGGGGGGAASAATAATAASAAATAAQTAAEARSAVERERQDREREVGGRGRRLAGGHGHAFCTLCLLFPCTDVCCAHASLQTWHALAATTRSRLVPL